MQPDDTNGKTFPYNMAFDQYFLKWNGLQKQYSEFTQFNGIR